MTEIPDMLTIERILQVLLWLAAITVFAGAILMMIDMDRSSISQGGRFYVAIFALVILVGLFSQLQKLLTRRIPFSLGTTPQESRYALNGFLLLTAAATVLLGVAWLLPS